jgi:hypothetical protein
MSDAQGRSAASWREEAIRLRRERDEIEKDNYEIEKVRNVLADENAALRAEVERRGALVRRMINRCRRCKGTGEIRLGSLALQGPYDRREPRACPDCSEARAALTEGEGGE